VELQDYLFIFRKNWLVVVLATIAGVGIALAYALLATPTYTASAKVFVSTSGASTVSELQQGNAFTLQRVKTYTDLVKTSAVLEPVIADSGARLSVAELRSRVSASAPLNTTVIDVTVSDTDAAWASRMATATAESLIEVVEDIETTGSTVGSPVRLTLVQAAEVPTKPTSPQRTLSLLLGLFVGLAAGVVFALLRATLDTRIRNERDVLAVTDRPVLGGIVFDPKAKERPLIVHADPKSPRAESFRTLRTNLQFLDFGEGRSSFVITSSEPAEGKSTTAANLALTLTYSGARVLLVGADLRKPKVADYLKIEGGVGLSDVLVGRASLEDAVQRWGQTELYALPAGSIPPNPSELLGSSRMSALIDQLDADYDFVLYDAPPLLPVTDAAVLARLVGATIVVTASGRTRSPHLRGALDALENVGARVSGIVLTMLPTRGPDAYGYGRYGYVYGERATEL
jgi:capsular exopolysaccharide synthesis family protein